ncbi:MAG: DUF1858 domain-containing protein [Bacteroidales bacterium]|jgi:hypothetical protein|nr:DUF1858 domain-containing protein [Bacteroidales bacterium]MDD4059058.1 DUF1858 domain-containing protein [Bacteroidales bacterium]
MKEITLDTKISEILNERPELEQTLLGLSPAFAKLQSPLLRKTVARVTSVKQAAAIAGINSSHMLTMLRKAAGMEVMAEGDDGAEAEHLLAIPCPEWFIEEQIKYRFDASGVLEAGNVPMGRIIDDAKKLLVGEIYLFTTPFVPAPIIEILENKGYYVWSRRVEGVVENYVIRLKLV